MKHSDFPIENRPADQNVHFFLFCLRIKYKKADGSQTLHAKIRKRALKHEICRFPFVDLSV